MMPRRGASRLLRPALQFAIHLLMWTDWNVYAQAVLVFLSGGNPYAVTGFYNPVWALPFFIPFVMLGAPAGQIAYSAVAYMSFALVAMRLKASIPSLLFFVFSLPVFWSAVNCVNLDWLVLFSLFTPAPVALILAMTKPQIGICIAVYILYRAFREKRLIRTAAPLAILTAITVAIYGLPNVSVLSGAWWNISLFPYSIPVGIALLVIAILRRDKVLTVPASLALAPYFGLTTIAALIVPLLRDRRLMISLFVVTWAWLFLPK